MLQNPNFPSALYPAMGAYSAPQTPWALSDGAGARCPYQELHPRSRPFGPRVYGLRVQPITELANSLMIDIKCMSYI